MSHQRPLPRVEGGDARSADPAPHRQPDPGLVPGDELLEQRDPGGGPLCAAAFFGWLAANGLMVILLALVAASGTVLRLTLEADESGLVDSAATIGLGGAVAFVTVVTLSFLAGGYVAGRMSRTGGGMGGFGVWLLGVVVAVVLALAGVLYDARYDVLAPLNLPRIPLDEGDVTRAAVATLLVTAVSSLLAAILGGRWGERADRRIRER